MTNYEVKVLLKQWEEDNEGFELFSDFLEDRGVKTEAIVSEDDVLNDYI